MNYCVFWACLFSCAVLCNSAEVGKSIVVDKSRFSAIYPAVWFSPATGEIVSLKERSERAPEEKYEIWIEPADPEFRIWGSQTNGTPSKTGFALVGNGAEVFEKTTTWQARKLRENLPDLMRAEQGTAQPVFFCQARNSRCLIMITEMDSKKGVISFRWKLLTAKAVP